MEITVDQIEIGDEILIGYQGNIRLVKVLRKPKLSKKPDWRNRTVYSKTKCIMYYKQVTYTYNTSQGRTHTYIKEVSDLSKLNNNREILVDFNHRSLYLIHREL